MTLVDWLGALGVFQILLAYVLNLAKKVTTSDWFFLLLNTIGASMACSASILLEYWPFIILEGVWAFTSLISVIQKIRLKK
ncbi:MULTISPECIES: CBU_0592 family membrane protein [Leeuwenhoekiella]|jgi:hypothetical protein|uniref:CBU-0592-like domain-containing protein n=1 Tax=Leeuwenhoekiella blandensis (strain CECT 7118 / CCUG 51940 / KCTC 22103 / MED217) TaxID=398720 RepID=A3XMI7_LEEBM|nr:hypothetical protein [Leeuwenhoekiella blandensis]EAQ49231.1 hypothetical protein MED217_07496 [Leeuwenhoekiella blandensis MED217]MBQ52190.1 hypothetical protein [Leeuwenhoekiella sp.]|tara:strand:+ start:1204 stop:1446 length:243 start_codon:yes stop_codon:yes gene_type:complete